MNWYLTHKISSNKSNDIDVDYSEVNKKYISSIVEDIKKIWSNKNLEKIMEEIKDLVSRSETKVCKHLIGTVQGIKVFLVNGNEVKVKFFMDFVEGGNGMIYGKKEDENHPKYIPENEIWVDADVDIRSFPYILLHEAVEYYLMKNNKMNYEEAHSRANGVEKKLRLEKMF